MRIHLALRSGHPLISACPFDISLPTLGLFPVPTMAMAPTGIPPQCQVFILSSFPEVLPELYITHSTLYCIVYQAI